jgi:GPH family glycoside/pentoside/hexuronide:cation symporter
MSKSDLPAAPPLTHRTMLLYGLGSASNGVKNRSIATFLLLFYSQVMGVPAALIGTALAVTLVIDGLLDPVIGQLSDNLRSRWGRRHPLMYAAAIPCGIIFYLLWTPPDGWSETVLLAYMTVCVVALRFVDTFFEVPASAMAAELSSDYHQRTLLVAYRYFFTFAGGLLLVWAAYRFFLSGDGGDTGTEGLFCEAAYSNYAILAAAVITLSILVSTWGTHHRIPWLHSPPARRATLRVVVREVFETLANRSLWLANAAGLFTAIATGLVGGLATYFQIYFWQLTPDQLSYLPLAGIAAALIGIFLGPRLTKLFGKRRAGIGMFIALALVSIAPASLRLLGLLPPNGAPLILTLLLVEAVCVGALTLMTSMAITSMIVDVAEDSELRTGRRSEGLLVSLDNVLKKTTAGVGVFSAGLIITVAGMSDKVRPGEVPILALEQMGLIFVPVIATIYLFAALSLFAFPLDEASHERNLELLGRPVPR